MQDKYEHRHGGRQTDTDMEHVNSQKTGTPAIRFD